MALLPINKTVRISKKSIELDQINLNTNSLSGDLIDGGTITNFNSTGIKDTANETQITVKDGLVEIEKDFRIKGKIVADKLEYVEAQVPKLNVVTAVMINHNEVLWKDRLGASVQHSSLTTLGTLKNLKVSNTLFVEGNRVGINTQTPGADFSVQSNGYEIVTRHTGDTGFVGTMTHTPFSIGTDNTPRLIIKSNGDITTEHKVGIGVKNPTESLEVAGNIKFANKIFASGDGVPTTGSWTTGSIIWNNNPEINQSVGWICVKGGTPGNWRPFGLVR